MQSGTSGKHAKPALTACMRKFLVILNAVPGLRLSQLSAPFARDPEVSPPWCWHS